MSNDSHSLSARRRVQHVSDGVTATYIHDITRPPRRAGSVRPASVRLRPGARPRRVLEPVPVPA